MVPLPPTLKRPNRRNGVEQVTMLGVTLRITITLAGSYGMSLSVMIQLGREYMFAIDGGLCKV